MNKIQKLTFKMDSEIAFKIRSFSRTLYSVVLIRIYSNNTFRFTKNELLLF